MAAARRADPLASDSSRQLAQFFSANARSTAVGREQDELLKAVDATWEEALRLAPRSSQVRLEATISYLSLYEATKQKPNLERAVALASEACKLYPATSQTHWYHSQALKRLAEVSTAGSEEAARALEAARREAAEALRLDEIARAAGHLDRLLSPSAQGEAIRLANPAKRN